MTDTDLIAALILTPTQRLILQHLAEHHSTRGDATTGEQLSKDLDMKVHHLYRSLNSLRRSELACVQAGLIWLDHRGIEKEPQAANWRGSREHEASSRGILPEEAAIAGKAAVEERVPALETKVAKTIVDNYRIDCGCGMSYDLALGRRFEVSSTCSCGVEMRLDRLPW